MDQFLEAAEAHETGAWRDLAAAASGLGLLAEEDGGSLLMAAPGCPIPAFNRALGLGRDARVTTEELDTAASWFTERGVDRYWLQLGPGASSPAVERWLAARRAELEYRSVLLARRLEEPPTHLSSAFDVRPLGVDDAPIFGRLAADGFGWPPPAQGLSTCVVGRRGWRHYLAWDGAVPVGCAAAYEADGTVWLGFAAVARAHRRSGGQATLLARRMIDATPGCHTAVVDVAEGSVSHRNCERAGFRELAVRPIYRVSRGRGLIRRVLGV